MSNPDTGYMQYLAYLQSSAAQNGAIGMLQQSIADNSICSQFENTNDQIVGQSTRLGDLANVNQQANNLQFCGLGDKVTSTGYNVQTNVVRESQRLGDFIGRHQVSDLEQFCALGDKVHMVGHDGVNNVNRVGDQLQSTAERNGIATREAVERTAVAIERATGDSRDIVKESVERNGVSTRLAVHDTAANLKDQTYDTGRWLHENIISHSSNLKDVTNTNGQWTRDAVNSTTNGLKDSVTQQAINLKDVFNAQSINIKDLIQSVGVTGRDATERANVNILTTAAQTQQALAASAFEARLGAKDIAYEIDNKSCEIKDTVYQSSKNLENNLASTKYEQLKSQERLSSQLYQTQSIALDQIKESKYDTASKLCNVEHSINANVDGNFRFTNEKLCDGKYEALKNKEELSKQMYGDHYQTVSEITKVSNDLGKALVCGFTNVSQQLNDAKYEALKNKEKLYAQAATNFAAQQLDAYKNKTDLAMQMAEFKFEACKGKDALSRELAECCCEIKMQAAESKNSVQKQIDDCCCELKMEVTKGDCEINKNIDLKSMEAKELARYIDGVRVRDELREAQTENTALKYCNDDYGYGYGKRRRGENKNYNYNYVEVEDKHHKRGRNHGRHFGSSSRSRSSSSSDDESHH